MKLISLILPIVLLSLLLGCAKLNGFQAKQDELILKQDRLSVDDFAKVYTEFLEADGKTVTPPEAALSDEKASAFYYDITPDEVYSEIGCQIFKVNSTCESYILYNNDIIPIGVGFGGWGLVDIDTCDFDKNGQADLIYTYSWGSGLHRSIIGIFNFTDMKQSELDYAHLNSDMMIEKDGDTFRVYDAAVSMQKQDYCNLNTKKGDALLTIISEGNKPKLIEQA